MIPLVAFPKELSALRAMVEAVVADVLAPRTLRVGTMIELPAACLAAEQIAANADFFSFGTNDLTPDGTAASPATMPSGASCPGYIERGIVERSPFETIDVLGVGDLVRIAAERARKAKPDLSLGCVRRTRRRPRQHRVLSRGRPRLRQLLTVPGPDRAGRGGPGGAVRVSGRGLGPEFR